MTIKLGNTDINRIYLGNTEINRAYLGNTLVYDKTSAFLLDAYPGAETAYSVARRLDSTYTGSLIRVRRSNDNAEQDIGYDGNNALDESALTNFVGANNGFIVTLYDQSGNVSNMTQTTNSLQPQIVSSGVVEILNGKPAMLFDGTDDYLTAGTGFNTSNGYSAFSVSTTADGNVGGNNAPLYGIWAIASAISDRIFITHGAFQAPNTMNTFLENIAGGSGRESAVATNDVVANTQQLTSGLFQASSSLYTQGVFRGSDTQAASPNSISAGAEFRLGQRFGVSFVSNLSGTIQEMVLYKNDQSSNRVGIETNINNFYSIY